jgi:hypothetical protein
MARITAYHRKELCRFRRRRTLGDSRIEQLLVVCTNGNALMKSRMMPDAHWYVQEPTRWSPYHVLKGKLPTNLDELTSRLTSAGWVMEDK